VANSITGTGGGDASAPSRNAFGPTTTTTASEKVSLRFRNKRWRSSPPPPPTAAAAGSGSSATRPPQISYSSLANATSYAPAATTGGTGASVPVAAATTTTGGHTGQAAAPGAYGYGHSRQPSWVLAARRGRPHNKSVLLQWQVDMEWTQPRTPIGLYQINLLDKLIDKGIHGYVESGYVIEGRRSRNGI
jgi:hypothetical protein